MVVTHFFLVIGAAPLPIHEGHWLARCSYLQAVEALWCPIHDGVERGSTS